MMNPAQVERIVNGYMAFVYVDGHQVNGAGASEQAAMTELEANLDLDRRLRERCAEARRAARPILSIP